MARKGQDGSSALRRMIDRIFRQDSTTPVHEADLPANRRRRSQLGPNDPFQDPHPGFSFLQRVCRDKHRRCFRYRCSILTNQLVTECGFHVRATIDRPSDRGGQTFPGSDGKDGGFADLVRGLTASKWHVAQIANFEREIVESPPFSEVRSSVFHREFVRNVAHIVEAKISGS